MPYIVNVVGGINELIIIGRKSSHSIKVGTSVSC